MEERKYPFIDELQGILQYIIDSYNSENSSIRNIKTEDICKVLTGACEKLGSGFCREVVITNNTDNIFFGIRVNPCITKSDVVSILNGDATNICKDYKLDIDSKLFGILNAEEIALYIVHDIESIYKGHVLSHLMAAIDMYLTGTDDTISFRDSINYYQLVIYAIKGTMTSMGSLLSIENPMDLINKDSLLREIGKMDVLVNAFRKIIGDQSGPGDSLRAPDMALLRWMFVMYKDMDRNSRLVRDTLKDAYVLTGSTLDKREIDKTLKSLDVIDNTVSISNEGCDLITFLENNSIDVLNESLFSGLKKKGLRTIEDDLYTVSLQIKNLETENEAIYTMRFINTRLNILEDYLYENQEISDREKKHWMEVAQKYRMLREELVRKKIWNRKQYGLFYDYNQLEEGEE